MTSEATVAQFRDAIRAAGLTPPDVIKLDGNIYRFSTNGKVKDDAGWYALHDGAIPAGVFGDHRTGMYETWRADIGRVLTPAEESAHRTRVDAMQKKREGEEARRRAGAAKKAAALWAAAKPASADHPYLMRKNVGPVENLRELGVSEVAAILGYTPKSSNEALAGRILIAPVHLDSTLSTCELIDSDGRKSAIYGGAKAGGYWSARSLPDDRDGLVLFICEGVATTLTALEASGQAGIAALSSGNLLKVAKAMRQRYPTALLVVVADLVKATGEPDHHAKQAAQAVGGRLLAPTFGDDRASGETDINDMAARLGLEEVRRAIEAVTTATVTAPLGLQGESADLPDGTAPASSGEDSASLRPRFTVSASGVFYIGVKHDSNAETNIELPPIRLCDRLAIIGRGEDDAGRGYRILRWNSRGSGTERVTAFPLAMIGEREGWAMLKERGLAIATSTSRAPLEKLSEYLQTEGSDELYFVTECGGWTRGAYILPSGEVLGKPSTPLFYRGDTSGASAYTTKGTLEEWRNTVARLAHGNTRPMLSLAVAFAAPLLEFLNLESGGFHLYGPSGAGKTTSAKIGASVWGSPREQVLNWDATALALANAASARNDGMMLLDEMGQGNPDAVGMAAYRLFNGTGKMQGAKDGGNRDQARWRVMVLSTGEIDLAAFMSGGGKRTRAGQEVRLASLPADVGKGLGAFDQLNGFPNSGQLAEAMEAAALKTHGVVGRAFVERIAVQRTEITARLRTAIQKIHAGLPEGASGQVRRVAARFAVAAEALEIATDEGMTGWDSGDGHAAVMVCFQSWLSRYGIGNREDEQIIDQAEAWFASHAFSRFIDCFDLSHSDKHPVVHDCAGYRKTDGSGTLFWLVFRGNFVNEIAQGHDKSAAANALEKAGMLQKGNDGVATMAQKIPGQPGKLDRYYKFVGTARKDQGK